MHRLITWTAKAFAGATLAAVFTAVSLVPNAQPAWAPQMVALELEAIRALGYQVCEPVISQLPADRQAEGVLADANNGEQNGTCEIRFAVDIPAEELDWVAWHEVAHLATVHDIYEDPYSGTLEDPAHQHPMFLNLLDHGPSERGGY